MTKNQSSKLNALLSVQTLLTLNRELVATVAALDESTETLVNLIMEVNTHLKIQSSPSGASEGKQEALVALGDSVYEIAGAVLSFAEKTGADRTLAARVRFSRCGITAGSSNAIVARCQDIIDAATANVQSLKDHGVTTAKMNEVKQKLKTYDGLRVMPRQAKAAAAAATKQLEQLFSEADRLLNNRIDKLVWQFRSSTPEFYHKYQVARTVVYAPTSSSGHEATVVPIPNAIPETKAA